MPQLRRTILETWAGIYKPGVATPELHETTPVEHHIIIPASNWEPNVPFEYNRGTPGLDMQVYFLGLDKPADVKTLLSLEVTWAFFNEGREIPKAIIDAMTGRVGRYPSIASAGVTASWYGIWCDTNPPDDEHWLHTFEYEETPRNWEFFHQPPGVLEAKETECGFVSVDKEYPGIEVWSEDYTQRVGKKIFIVNPFAENLPNLPHINPETGEQVDAEHHSAYYLNLITGKSEPWIVPYAQGRYGYVQEGKPVIPEFNEYAMVRTLKPLPNVPIEGGVDMGGGTFSPSMIIGQRHPVTGTYLALDEITIDNIALERFSEECNAVLSRNYSKFSLSQFWGDPAGQQRDGVFGIVYFEHMIARGIPVVAAESNDIEVRINAIKAPMLRFIPGDQTPGVLIDPKCKRLIKGLKGSWQYKRMQTADEKFSQVPDKNQYSHPCDAFGYWLLGGGEGRKLRTPVGSQRHTKVIRPQNDWSPLSVSRADEVVPNVSCAVLRHAFSSLVGHLYKAGVSPLLGCNPGLVCR